MFALRLFKDSRLPLEALQSSVHTLCRQEPVTLVVCGKEQRGRTSSPSPVWWPRLLFLNPDNTMAWPQEGTLKSDPIHQIFNSVPKRWMGFPLHGFWSCLISVGCGRDHMQWSGSESERPSCLRSFDKCQTRGRESCWRETGKKVGHELIFWFLMLSFVIW